MIRFKNVFLKNCNGLFEYIFENYRSKKFYFKLSLVLMLSSIISLFYFSAFYVSQLLVQNINESFFDKTIEVIVKSIFTLFIIYILYLIIKNIYTFKHSSHSLKEEIFVGFEKVVTLLFLLFFSWFFFFLLRHSFQYNLHFQTTLSYFYS